MKLTFINDIQEISDSACRAFISTFHYISYDSDPDSEEFEVDLDPYVCGEITPEVEDLVDSHWELCKSLEEVFRKPSAEVIKKTICTVTEETQCVGIKLFNFIEEGEDKNLIELCTAISFWCCCETIKKVSPVIAKATVNLIY